MYRYINIWLCPLVHTTISMYTTPLREIPSTARKKKITREKVYTMFEFSHMYPDHQGEHKDGENDLCPCGLVPDDEHRDRTK